MGKELSCHAASRNCETGSCNAHYRNLTPGFLDASVAHRYHIMQEIPGYRDHFLPRGLTTADLVLEYAELLTSASAA